MLLVRFANGLIQHLTRQALPWRIKGICNVLGVGVEAFHKEGLDGVFGTDIVVQ